MNSPSIFSLDDRVALVTGGAGLYGRQIARALAEAGARTIMASRNVVKLQTYAQTLCDEGFDVHAYELDQADDDSVTTLCDQLAENYGGVDVLVNNAVSRPMADWSDPLECWRESLEVNATGIFNMTRVFGDAMGQRGRGSIINVGSIQGMVGPDFSLYKGFHWNVPPDYFFNKGGMIQLSKYAAAKLGPRGVRVNCISPGGFYNDQDPVFLKRYKERTFLGRMANDQDLQGVIVFLASDASAYITGANIPVDGGYTAK